MALTGKDGIDECPVADIGLRPRAPGVAAEFAPGNLLIQFQASTRPTPLMSDGVNDDG